MTFEQLGLFYLGRRYDAVARQRLPEPVLYDAADLVTHAVCIGMTGSGKTGLGISLIEEAAIDGIPVLAIDPKGDLGNLMLTFPGLTAAEFAPWVNPDEARGAGLSTEALAEREAARWSAGLADWGQDGARIRKLKDAADVAIYTPGSRAGLPLSILDSFRAPPTAVRDEPELLAERVQTSVTSLLTLAGVDADPARSREHILVSTVLTEAWRAGRDLDLAGLIAAVQSPPVTTVGVLDLESFYPAKERFDLAMRLNHLLAAPGFAAWMEGAPLDIDRLLYTPEGRPRVAVISIAHLGDAERMFFVSLLLGQVIAWMRAQRGTSTLRALVYMDELFGFLPPTANPPSKTPLLTLLKQARAYGLGLVLSTQNPVDLDYKALSNAGTWFLGRLQTERDKARVLDGLEGVASGAGAGLDRASLDRLLSGLDKRVFLLHNVHAKAPEVFQTRWALSYLRGPLGRDEIRQLMGGATTTVASEASSAPAAPVSHPEGPDAAEAPARAPLLPPSIPQFFAPGPGGPRVARLLGIAQVRFTDRKLGVDEVTDLVVTTGIGEGAIAVDWSEARPAPFGAADLSSTPPRDTTFASVPASATRVASYKGWAKGFAVWLGAAQGIEVLTAPRLKLASAPGESERDFRIRLQTSLRERRDEAKQRIAQKYAAKLQRLDDRIRTADAAVEREQGQAADQKLQTAVSFGAAVLGAVFGRKAVSASSIGKATTAARGLGRVGREARDVARATGRRDDLVEERRSLEAEMEEELHAAHDEFDALTEPLEAVRIPPARGGISVQQVGLVWVSAGGER
ncbi:MAG: hypothetical protein Q8L86_09960 [Vicinamibacterales bacterium]|nr:hypothetical protein [Vicinamibacterales bacterium]